MRSSCRSLDRIAVTFDDDHRGHAIIEGVIRDLNTTSASTTNRWMRG
jgi:hypothetical protein